MSQPTTHREGFLTHAGGEPFRLFFPAAVLAGIIGVSLWPLHFIGWMEFYPGQLHARLMASGFFGGIIVGFLGTAMPRMLSAAPFKLWQSATLLGVHLLMILSLAGGKQFWGDALFLILLGGFAACVAVRATQRQDTPPPGFVLVGLGLACVAAGTLLSLMLARNQGEPDVFWTSLQRLLSYQGFVLLPILGVGPFILPRFFGQPSPHNFPEMLIPTPAWARKALLALAAGIVILGSFIIEARGGLRLAYAVRFATTLAYLLVEMPFRNAPGARHTLGAGVRVAFVLLVSGFLAVACLPGQRVALLHLTLVGGFALISFLVATRVVFGHSGNLERLKDRNRWLIVALALMLLGLATRITGDFKPSILPTHYSYGALAWIAGVLLWSWRVLPKVAVARPEAPPS